MMALLPRISRLSLVVLAASLLGSCQSQDPGVPTYHGAIKPILDSRCANCHRPGDIAPFSLTSYEEAYSIQRVIGHSIETGSMPPWMPDNSCNDYSDDFSLGAEEQAAVLAWVEAGAPQGHPDADHSPQGDMQDQQELYDFEMVMNEAYVPQTQPDDYRCFLLDWPGSTEQFVTGYQVKPGQSEIVHHVISFVVGPEAADEYRAMDENDEGQGYSCFGSPYVGESSLEDSLSWRWLGSWAPGIGHRNMPQDSGLRVEPGSIVVMQVHYNSRAGTVLGDQTRFQVQVEDEVALPAVVMPFTHYRWAFGIEEMLIPAGEPQVVHRASRDLSEEILGYLGHEAGLQPGDSFQVHSVGIHMHLLGTRAQLWLERSEAAEQCLLDIPKWNFEWQGSYDLSTAVTIHQGDVLNLECEWDNSPENQPVFAGQRSAPRDVGWGDGTDDEMCLAVLYVTAVP